MSRRMRLSMSKTSLKKITAGTILFLIMIVPVAADDLIPEKARVCVACHGALGVSNYDLWPNIAGQKKTYMINQLKAFRDGSRYDPWMTPMALPLSDEEIKELANFFSKLK